MDSDHCNQRQEALESECDSLIQNDTRKLVPPPKNKHIVGSQWVIKVKIDANGNLDRFKARLVAQGYSQTLGVDYNEVFSPAARYSTLRWLIALANANDWEIHQMDVNTAFLNGSIETDIYMSQQEGFVDSQHPEYIWKLNKSLYGLELSARCWNTTLDKFLISSGCQKSNAEGCVYIKSTKKADGKVSFAILAVYVGDIMPLSNDVDMLLIEKENLCKKFKMVDHGEAHSILGMLIKRDRAAKTLVISQSSYLQNLLKKFNMENCKPVATLLEAGKKFQKTAENEEAVDPQLYQQAICSLIYASTSTRQDIAAAVGVLSQYSTNPSKQHCIGVKRILRYTKKTVNYSLKFSINNENTLHGFCDADWAGDVDDPRATSGYIFKIGNATVNWCS